MATATNVEVEAAKFLLKLIQESPDEPAKLATKLYVICQHMKLSGKGAVITISSNIKILGNCYKST
ncbi:hypothetical protein IHE45_18G049000 [Dioscorea alata]|uniref:Uncharacterized protein n=1 Tax=Dioscorea alata TaxID=55571 RepID=A0ACB7U6U6_DIOAL|nr:hypothetical protein IHE45_18G049000 [Dioscorea alata]